MTQLLLKASFLLHAGNTRVVGTSCVFEEYGAMEIATGKWVVMTEMANEALPNEEFNNGPEAIARAMEKVGWSAQNVAQAELDADDRRNVR